MKEVIMIKYAELTTKKDNRNFFINTLEKNVLSCLDGLNPTIRKDYYRMFIYVSDIESSTVTSEFGGKFKDAQARREFLDYIKLETKF